VGRLEDMPRDTWKYLTTALEWVIIPAMKILESNYLKFNSGMSYYFLGDGDLKV